MLPKSAPIETMRLRFCAFMDGGSTDRECSGLTGNMHSNDAKQGVVVKGKTIRPKNERF